MSELPFLSELLVIPCRFAYRTCHADRSDYVSYYRDILCLSPEQPDSVKRYLCPAGVKIHRAQFLIVLNCIDRVARYMRFEVLCAHGAARTQRLSFDSHAERHAIVLKAFIIIYGLCQICHHPRVSMSFRQINSADILQSLRDHIHHSARAYAGRPVSLHTRKNLYKSFISSCHFISSFI